MFVHTETVRMAAPHLTRPYRFLHISDAHIAVAAPSDSGEAKAFANQQAKRWSLGTLTSTEAFEEVLTHVRDARPDGLLMAGDCVDYISDANVAYMESRMAELRACGIDPLYVYGNHEGGSYTAHIPDPRVYYPQYCALMGHTPDFWVKDYGDLLVVGVDDSDRRITLDQLEKMQAVTTNAKERGIAMLLVLHIPLYTEELAPKVLPVWGPSFMLGSLDTDPDTVHEFCRLVKAPDSPVAAIFAGHIHFAHTGEFADGRMQYVSAPGFEGFVREIRIEP
ncbi:MAG: metallophosphoesterase [Clostridia bacterium]|nr:metallophosphoesterase [Clostridia bacterium]